MLDQSSCDPGALLFYSQDEDKRVEQLTQLHTSLQHALEQFFATCTEFRPIAPPEEMTAPLQAHKGRIEEIAAWVDTVANEFVRADGGGQPFFVTPLQQTLPLGPHSATLEPKPLPALSPALNLEPSDNSDQSFFVAPLQQTLPINLNDATVYPTLPPPSNARFKLIENQPRNMAELALLINERYLQDDDPEEKQAGPIGITQIGPNRYLVTLVGIEWDTDNEANRLKNAIIDQGTPFNSAYFNIVEKTIRANIPVGAELVLAAHSHGGIVAQNLAGNSSFNQNEWASFNWFGGADDEYNVTDVITFGSPVAQLPTGKAEYHMYGVAGDIVPILGVAHVFDSKVMEDSGKFHHLPGAPEGMSAHSLGTYAQLLAADDRFNELSFTIDEWGPTYTFAADDWHDSGAELGPFPEEER